MQTRILFAAAMLCGTLPLAAQTDSVAEQQVLSESAFTFTEAQMGEDDVMSQNVTIINANANIYANNVGYRFSPTRFRYRAFNQKYNEVSVGGALLNDMETGQFRFSQVGGLNPQTRGVEFALPFEDNGFGIPAMAGSNNYNFRAANMPSGHRATLSGANRNYTLRAMYSYSTGLSNKGWAFSGALAYRWAKEGYVEGTFYNSLSYFLAVQKVMGKHSIALSTWGAPTERASQGAGTDEVYWLANDRFYNPYWGWQNGKKRNSRIVNDFAPTAALTWDWTISDNAKLTTTLVGRYSMYKSTKLNYNNSDNPLPNYWKNLPSSYYDVWDADDATNRTAANLADWTASRDFWMASKENRQLNWDRLYYSNQQMNAQGTDAMYYIQAKRNDALTISFATTFNKQLTRNSVWNIGLIAGGNIGRHYQTMEDMLGASVYHNLNTYAIGTYAPSSPEVQYDLRRPNAEVGVGDVFGYDYRIYVSNGKLWTNYAATLGHLHYSIAGKIGYTAMQRKGYMQNGLAPENSYGKSGTAEFIDGGLKFSSNLDCGRGHVLTLGLGYEQRAPQAQAAFAAPEINNDFCTDLHNEQVLSMELGYQYANSWLHANINAYYTHIEDATEWQNFYFDDINSFSYVSLTGIRKEYYGVELGAKFKITSAFDINLLGTISEAKNINDSHVRYMNSTSAKYIDETCYNKNMRESGTPLTAVSLGLSYHKGGWFVDLNGNWYDRIYLSYAPCYRYESTAEARKNQGALITDNDGNLLRSAFEQAKGHGGFMVDGSIGKNIYLKRGSLSINLSVTNILNNRSIVTGGYESSRSDYTNSGNARTYKFSRNPMKFYAYGTNGMLNLTYKF